MAVWPRLGCIAAGLRARTAWGECFRADGGVGHEDGAVGRGKRDWSRRRLSRRNAPLDPFILVLSRNSRAWRRLPGMPHSFPSFSAPTSSSPHAGPHFHHFLFASAPCPDTGGYHARVRIAWGRGSYCNGGGAAVAAARLCLSRVGGGGAATVILRPWESCGSRGRVAARVSWRRASCSDGRRAAVGIVRRVRPCRGSFRVGGGGCVAVGVAWREGSCHGEGLVRMGAVRHR